MPEPDPIWSLVFDCGDTLLALDPPRETICGQVLRDLGHDVPAAHVGQAYCTVTAHLPALASQLQTAEARRAYYRRFNYSLALALGLEAGWENFAEALTDAFNAHRRWTPQPGAIEALERLHRKYPCFVLANWDPGLDALLATAGLAGYFRRIVCSADLGAEKPNPDCFRGFLELAGLSAEKTVYVGNDYEADVVGSRSVGLHPILLDAARQYGPHVDCDYVTSWSELELAIDALSPVRG
jgi:putative hydrolase of the HAD superfamily